MDLTLCTEALSCWNRKGPPPNCCQSETQNHLEWHCTVCCSVKISLHWKKKGLSQHHKKQPQAIIPPSQLALAFRHPPNPDSSVRLPDGEAWFITPENTLPLLQSPMAASFTPLQPTLIEHVDLRLVCVCSAMDTHFMTLPTNSYCAEVAPRGSLELDSECRNRGQKICTHYALQHSVVPFSELVWPTISQLSHCCS